MHKLDYKLILTIFVGCVYEWYDFAIFMFLIPIVATQFFPQHAFWPLIFSYSINIFSYLIRPLGGMLFGHYGDKIGKSRILIVTMLMMALPSLCIALLPTYQQIGFIAPLLLLGLRSLQALSAGGELMGAVTYVYEITTPPWRNALTILVWIGSGVGILLGSVIILGLMSGFGKQIMMQGMWRLPFVLGSMLALLVFYIRKKMLQHMPTHSMKANPKPLSEILSQHKLLLLKFFLLFIPSACTFYFVFVYMPTYSTMINHLNYQKVFLINTIALIFLYIFSVLVGYVSNFVNKDKILKFSQYCLIVCVVPLYYFFAQGNLIDLLISQIFIAIVITLYACSSMLKILETAPQNISYSLLAISYNFSSAIFGGVIPLLGITVMLHSNFKELPGLLILFSLVLSLLHTRIVNRT